MADEITLSDKYVLLLQNSIQETSAFRKEIATKEKSQDSRINQLIEKLEEIGDKIEGASSKGKAKKISRTEQSIPKRCRLDFRQHYKLKLENATDFSGFVFSEGFTTRDVMTSEVTVQDFCSHNVDASLLETPVASGKKRLYSQAEAPLIDTEPASDPEDVIGVNLIEELGLESSTLKRFKDASNKDETSRVVMEYVLKRWPREKDQVDELAKEYWSYKEELSVEDGLLFKSDRIVVPRSLRADMLEEIHGAHMGESKSLSYGRDYVFWPSMTAQVKDKVSSCPICNAFRNRQQRETLHPHDIPGLPWQVVGTDIFEYAGHSYLLVTDFYSKYFEIELLRQSTATCVINNLKKIFARFGIPAEVISDNGSQYSNTRNLFNSTHEFKKFAEEWGFCHTTSSPEYPQSNGAAERAVQTAKRILKKAAADNKDPFEGLLKYRNTPFEDLGVSPTQLLMSRRTRTTIPTHRRLLLPQAVDPNHVVKVLQHRQDVSKKNYDKNSRDLPPLDGAL
ncbi:hypothetical protein QZH41_003773 [Actinostola sp. cb2023]|nr:hypothetical protein QZH41_003773 [Actinostola sp. cb2023]